MPRAKNGTTTTSSEQAAPALQTPQATEISPPAANTSPTSPSPQKRFDISKLIETVFKSLEPEPPLGLDKTRNDMIRDYLRFGISTNPLVNSYNILVLHDDLRMVKGDADNIYDAAATFTERRPLLLVLYSSGGTIGSAYLIGKLCREYANDRLVVVVPRQAKSAATLLCCAADEIHMGSLSELGPIDPQIENLPALGLKSSVEHIADLTKNYPHASEMFAKYLHLSLKPIHLGYYERVAESAAQYAERLLNLHGHNLKKKPAQIAKELVYSYKDHGFVIDKSEAAEIFGDRVVRTGTDEYQLGNTIYGALQFLSKMADYMNHHFYFVGSLDSDPHFFAKKPKH